MYDSQASLAAILAITQMGRHGRGTHIQSPVRAKQRPPNVGRNEPCPCGSGRKYKKCCLAQANGTYKRDPDKLPTPVVLVDAAVTPAPTGTVKPNVAVTAHALLNAKVSQSLVWAYICGGVYITETTKQLHPPHAVERWHAAIQEFNSLPVEQQAVRLKDAIGEGS